jgi:hypothetical protein
VQASVAMSGQRSGTRADALARVGRHGYSRWKGAGVTGLPAGAADLQADVWERVGRSRSGHQRTEGSFLLPGHRFPTGTAGHGYVPVIRREPSTGLPAPASTRR